MKKKRILMLIGSICLALMLAVPFVVACAAPPTPTPVGPEIMTWSAYNIGSSGYMMCGFLGEAIMDKYGTKVRVVPAAADIARVLPLRAGDIDVAFHGLGAYFMQEGLYEYGEMDWGPQPVRYIWSKPYPTSLGVRGDSDIYTAADLRGKRVSWNLTNPGHPLLTGAHLAFGGLTWDDVERVDTSNYSAAIQMLAEGKLDVTHISCTAPVAYEMAASPSGLRYIELPHEDTEGWKRASEYCTAFGQVTTDVTACGTFSAEHPLETGGWSYPVALVYDWSDEGMCYFLAKAIHETHEMTLPKHEVFKYCSIENHWVAFEGGALPLHEGAIRYYKEIGQWTPEREAMNQERIDHQAALKKLWDAVYEEALEKGMEAKKEFPEFWRERRAAAGL